MLVSDDAVDDIRLLPRRQHQVFGTRIGRVEIDGNLLDGGVGLDIVHSSVQRLVVEGIDDHIDTDVPLSRAADILLQMGKSTLAPNSVMALPHPVHRNPDGVRMNPREILLGIGGDCDRKETDTLGGIDDVVDSQFVLAPKSGFAPLKVNETRAQAIGIAHVGKDVLKGTLPIARAAINGTMFATEVALVGNKQDGLQRCLPPEKASAHKPLGEIKVLTNHGTKVNKISETHKKDKWA